jgi:hypothetical protein
MRIIGWAVLLLTAQACAHTVIEKKITGPKAETLCTKLNGRFIAQGEQYYCQPTRAGNVGPAYAMEFGSMED